MCKMLSGWLACAVPPLRRRKDFLSFFQSQRVWKKNMLLTRLPTEIWAEIFRHVPYTELIDTFNALDKVGVFGETRLDAFWKCVTFVARTSLDVDSLENAQLDSAPYKRALDILTSDGSHTHESALRLFHDCIIHPFQIAL